MSHMPVVQSAPRQLDLDWSAIDTTSFESDPTEVRVVNTPDGYKLHFLGAGSDKIFEMDINF